MKLTCFAVVAVLFLFALSASARLNEKCEKGMPCAKCSKCLEAGGLFCANKTWRPKASASLAIISGSYCVDPESNDAICDNGEPLDSCIMFEGLQTVLMPGIALPKERPETTHEPLLFRL